MVVLRGITAMFAGFIAVTEYNIKKIVAFSTLNQVRFIILRIGCGNQELGFFHLLLHAIFKALLFIRVGVIILNGGSSQDIRFFRGANKIFLYNITFIIISIFSLIGLPFLTGFFSKDCIIEFFLIRELSFSRWVFILPSLVISLLYRIRVLVYMYNSYRACIYSTEDRLRPRTFGIVILGVISVVLGSIIIWVIDLYFSFCFFSRVWWIVLRWVFFVSFWFFLKKVSLNLEFADKVFYIRSIPYILAGRVLKEIKLFHRVVDVG